MIQELINTIFFGDMSTCDDPNGCEDMDGTEDEPRVNAAGDMSEDE
jgi:hypothetical protein